MSPKLSFRGPPDIEASDRRRFLYPGLAAVLLAFGLIFFVGVVISAEKALLLLVLFVVSIIVQVAWRLMRRKRGAD